MGISAPHHPRQAVHLDWVPSSAMFAQTRVLPPLWLQGVADRGSPAWCWSRAPMCQKAVVCAIGRIMLKMHMKSEHR